MAEQTATPAVEASTTSSSGGVAAPPSSASLGIVTSSPSRSEYLDSLIVPSADELERIAQVQTDREAQIRRRSHSRSHSLQQQMAGLGMGDVSKKTASALVSPARAKPAVLGGLSTPATRHRSESMMRRLGLSLGSLGWNLGFGLDDVARTKAAILIQRHYRGYKTRRELKGLSIDANTRWVHALRELQYRQVTRPHSRPGSSATGGPEEDDALTGVTATRRNSARLNWKKATTVVMRAGLDQDSDSDSDSSSDSDSDSSDSDGGAVVAAWKSQKESRTADEKKLARQRREEAKAKRRREARTMGQQYFLEMVDPKHRYGANLRVYHEEWKRASTQENFFYWLDHGEGRRVDMAACPRERLDREQVRYLSREERQYYLVQVDREGRLCWAKNGARIDTSEKWKDSIHGIVPIDDPTPAYKVHRPIRTMKTMQAMRTIGEPNDSYSSESDFSDSSLSDLDIAASNEPVRRVHHISATTVFDALLRKSVQKNTWIFVADTSFRLYVGIKTSGTFQHSSFLQGTRISAAGLIRIRNGRVTSLSPLSGHYRPPASNFRAFVQSLKEAGVDTSRMTLSKSYGVLVGLEAYMKTRQRGKDLIKKMGKRASVEDNKEAAVEAAGTAGTAATETEVANKDI